jgi:hypothetical protein
MSASSDCSSRQPAPSWARHVVYLTHTICPPPSGPYPPVILSISFSQHFIASSMMVPSPNVQPRHDPCPSHRSVPQNTHSKKKSRTTPQCRECQSDDRPHTHTHDDDDAFRAPANNTRYLRRPGPSPPMTTRTHTHTHRERVWENSRLPKEKKLRPEPARMNPDTPHPETERERRPARRGNATRGARNV